MKKQNIFIFRILIGFLNLTIIITQQVFSQDSYYDIDNHRANTWIFGDSARIDFSVGEAVSSQTTAVSPLPIGCSSISDGMGDLLFYTDGIRLFNNELDTIPLIELLGNNFATQSSLIVPQPGNKRWFYVFTVDMYIPPIFQNGINYSVIDYPLAGELEIVSLNNELFKENSQKIAAVKHQNGHDYWIVVHGFGDEKGGNFYSYLLTADGLNMTPVVTTIGHKHTYETSSNNGLGQMKISPDGSKLALVVPYDGVVEVYDFNTETGKPFNLKSSNLHQFNWVLGLEFSSDASKLYITISPMGEGYSSIYKFDLIEQLPFEDPFLLEHFAVEEIGNADSILGTMQLGSDGRIYVAKFKRGVLSKNNLVVIYNPNRERELCNYNRLNNLNTNGLYLNGGGSLVGLPNFVSSFLDIPEIIVKGSVVLDTTYFFIRNTANIDSVRWQFEGEGELLNGHSLNPSYIYYVPGSHNVNLSTYFNGEAFNYSTRIDVFIPYIAEQKVFEGDVSVYPNPSDGKFMLNISNYQGEVDILIFNLTGNILFEEKNLIVSKEGFSKSLNLDIYADGFYLLQVRGKQGEYNTKLVVSKGG